MQKATPPTKDPGKQQSNNQDLHSEAEPTSEPAQDTTTTNTPQQESQPLQFVDTEGRTTGVYKRKSAAKKDRKHYFCPQIPLRTFRRGETRNLEDWLKDNPQHTEADFYWLCQNSDQIPPYSSTPRRDNNTYLTEDEGQFHDAL